MRWVGLALALLLAGCAEDPAPMVREEPTFSDVPSFQLHGPAPLRWTTLHEADFTLSPATVVQDQVTIPNGTIQVAINMTLDGGAGYGPRVSLGECTWYRELALVGTGQTIGADCGGLLDSAAALRIGLDAGALTGSLQVVALVCMPTALETFCPARLPATTE